MLALSPSVTQAHRRHISLTPPRSPALCCWGRSLKRRPLQGSTYVSIYLQSQLLSKGTEIRCVFKAHLF